MKEGRTDSIELDFMDLFFVSLLLSYLDQRKILKLKDWVIIIAAFLLCELYVDLFGLLIPVGFIMGLIYMNKRKSFFTQRR